MTLLQKLHKAYEAKDYSTLTSLELFQLVDQKMLRPETANRLISNGYEGRLA